MGGHFRKTKHEKIPDERAFKKVSGRSQLSLEKDKNRIGIFSKNQKVGFLVGFADLSN